MRLNLPLLATTFLVVTSISACTILKPAKVRPYEKEYLAQSHMAFEPDPLEARSKSHMYFSKEGSSGGYGVGGGGCGCN